MNKIARMHTETSTNAMIHVRFFRFPTRQYTNVLFQVYKLSDLSIYLFEIFILLLYLIYRQNCHSNTRSLNVMTVMTDKRKQVHTAQVKL